MHDIANKIVSRIYGHGNGWCFTPKDFVDLGSPESVRIKLFRLAKQQIIRRLAKGLYDYPEKHEQLGLLSPSHDAVAEALARHDRIRVQPTGRLPRRWQGTRPRSPLPSGKRPAGLPPKQKRKPLSRLGGKPSAEPPTRRSQRRRTSPLSRSRQP